jgi:hypothetical protein
MEESILESTKKILGLPAAHTAFDPDISTHINATFSTLYQMGIGPSSGFMIADTDDVWNDFLPNGPILNLVKSYMYLKVRMLFDPPGTSFAQTAMNDQIAEFENRILLANELTDSL